MIETLFILTVCAASYAVKGGWLAKLFPKVNKLRRSNLFYDTVLDGKFVATGLMVFLGFVLYAEAQTRTAELGVPYYETDVIRGLLFGAAFILSVAPSMGEENGAIGRTGLCWGPYVDNPDDFGRSYGIKKGIQRGVFIGAVMTLATGSLAYIPFSALYVPLIFVTQELHWQFKREDSWAWSEPAIGLVMYGIPTALAFSI